MRRSCLGTAGALLAFAFAGCGDTKDDTPITYKGTDSPAIQQLRDGMAQNVKNKSITSKGEEKPAGKDKAKEPPKDAPPEKK
jgi:hypothetical protein